MVKFWSYVHVTWWKLVHVVYSLVLEALGLSPPRHVALIMDGNRRYARRDNHHVTYGHRKGYERLIRVLKWCKWVGVREVTVFAFSIENFKRSDEEVAFLMQLAEEKFTELLDNMSTIHKNDVRVRIVGRLELLPMSLRQLIANLCVATSGNKTLQLNIAAPYTGRDELSRAATAIVGGVRSGLLPAQAVDATLVTRALELRAPDLLVRTSGEVRLSDFLIWQVSDTVLYFTDVLWPEFDFRHFMLAVLHYFRHAPRQRNKSEPTADDSTKPFLDYLEKSRWREMEILSKC